MRAYKFLDARFGLKSLYERRLKQSRITELNDVFELSPYDVTEVWLRHAFLKTRDDLDREKGIVCFSDSWSNPVIWAHYSDNHKGLCLGFEIPEIKGDPEDESMRVTYAAKLLQFPPDFESVSENERFRVVQTILFTKFIHWEYEKEIRIWAPLQNEENGINYLEFDPKLRLVEVIIGAKCSVSKQAVMRALEPSGEKVLIIKARAAYNRFEIVEDEEWRKEGLVEPKDHGSV